MNWFARSILRMGVPVATRNIFPSNIQGLPTWFEVRVSGKGWVGRRGGCDLMVAMNPQTWDKDVASLDAGGYLFYDSSKPMPESKFRADIHVIGMPLTEICKPHLQGPPAASAFQEHHLCRRAVGDPRYRFGGGRKADQRPIRRRSSSSSSPTSRPSAWVPPMPWRISPLSVR